jgi:hypothetical protein
MNRTGSPPGPRSALSSAPGAPVDPRAVRDRVRAPGRCACERRLGQSVPEVGEYDFSDTAAEHPVVAARCSSARCSSERGDVAPRKDPR